MTNFRGALPGRLRPVLPAAAAGLLACGVLSTVGLTAQAASASPLPACGAPVISGGTATVTCGYTGAARYFTVPAGVTQATFTLYGAEGGASLSGETGGVGAEVTAVLPVSAGTVLQVNAGQAGGTNDGTVTFNGGGADGGSAGDGGGATDVRSPASDGSYPVTSSVLVAGGGGGAGADGQGAGGGTGGNADSAGGSGGDSVPGFVDGGGGGGAGTTALPGGGGGGGSSPLGDGAPGSPGGTGASQGTGGAGGPGAGGGGGGFYGGGGGGQGGANFIEGGAGNGGGGGGASYTGSVSGANVTDGVAAPDDAPNGEVVITYTPVAPLAVTTTSLPAATLGKPYSATLAATGGVPPYTWSVTTGALPTGLSLNATTGVISGTPVVLGSGGFTVGVKDSESPAMTASQALSITTGGCTTTVTGNHAGALKVGSGVTCIVQASISGPVTISAGATVAVSQSTLSGPLSSSGTATLSVCATSIAGPVSVTGSTGFVLVGDAGDDGAPGCGANTIGGPAVLANNTGGVQLGGNTIHGPVSLTGNSGGPGTEVAANHIGGPLACSGNTPAPTDNSQPNTVSGPAAGQCSGLA